MMTMMMMMMLGETDTGNSRRRIFVLAWSNIGCGMKKLSRLKTRYLERVRTNRQTGKFTAELPVKTVLTGQSTSRTV